MGIKFTCPHCKNALNVKSNLAGKRGRCPKCDGKIDIPTESAVAGAAAPAAAIATPAAPVSAGSFPPAANAKTLAASPAPLLQEETDAAAVIAAAKAAPMAPEADRAESINADAISAAPQMQWYVMPPGASSQYGPAAGDAFRSWIKEGRVAADSLVWRQDWPEWKRAGSVFPELEPSGGRPPNAPNVAVGFALPTAVGALPTATGVLPMAGTFPMAGTGFPTASAAPDAIPVAAGGFPVVPPAGVAGTPRRTQYRPRSNTGPIVAIVVLVILMIPLSFFVIKVLSEQFSQPPPPSPPAAGSNSPDQ